MSRYGGPTQYRHGSNVQIQEPNLDIQSSQNPQGIPFSHEELDYVDFIQNRKPYRDELTLGETIEVYMLEYVDGIPYWDETGKYVYITKDKFIETLSIDGYSV